MAGEQARVGDSEVELSPLKRQIAEKALAAARRFTARAYASDVELFEWTADLLNRQVFPKLSSVAAEEWVLTEPALVDALGAIGGEEVPPSFAAGVIAYLILTHGSEIGRVPEKDELVSMIGTLANRLKVAYEIAEKLKAELGDEVSREVSVLGYPYEVFEGPFSRPATELNRMEMWDRMKMNQFVVFVDTTRRAWLYKDGESMKEVPLQAGYSKEWHFLCVALRNVGNTLTSKELQDETERDYGSQLSVGDLWQLRRRLNRATSGVAGKIIEGQKYAGGYRIHLADTCLIMRKQS